jgi:tryptophanyl-tRNA synthetase
MRNKKTVLCTKHKNIISYYDICLESKNELSKDVINFLNKIKETVREANEDAKAMEERLYKYKLAIEKLGFKRVK